MEPVKIELVDIKKLTLLENNPRKITKGQMDNLCKSIESDPGFLFNRPILVHDKDGILDVYAGNQRVRAAKKLKWKEIPCIIEKDLSAQIIKERIIKDNKTYGEFDFDILAGDYEIEMLLDCGFEMKDLGAVDEKIQDNIEAKEKEEKPKQLCMCPQCGCEF